MHTLMHTHTKHTKNTKHTKRTNDTNRIKHTHTTQHAHTHLLKHKHAYGEFIIMRLSGFVSQLRDTSARVEYGQEAPGTYARTSNMNVRVHTIK